MKDEFGAILRINRPAGVRKKYNSESAILFSDSQGDCLTLYSKEKASRRRNGKVVGMVSLKM